MEVAKRIGECPTQRTTRREIDTVELCRKSLSPNIQADGLGPERC